MSEESYAFRLRYTRSPRDTVNCYEKALPLPAADKSHEIVLKAREDGKTVEASGSLVLHGEGWPTAEEAERAGSYYADILARVCARLRLGADFGDRAGKSWITDYGLDLMSQKLGRPVLNDVHGLMVYERTSRPTLVFSSQSVNLRRGIVLEQFLSVYNAALDRSREVTEDERTAMLLFNSSFFPESPDGRFLLLMMGVEALIERQPQQDKVKAIVQSFMSEIEASTGFTKEEKDGLKSGLGQLGKESFRQAGRRLVRNKLGERKYGGTPAVEFFDLCYDLRSKLVHGELPFPTRDKVGSAAAQLEVMLSDLLSTDLLDVGPQP